MKPHKRFNVIFTAIMILSLLVSGSAYAKSPNKVEICHNNGNGAYSLVKIKTDTLPTHLAHGDAAPGAAVPGQAGMVFSASCSVIPGSQGEPDQPVNVPGNNHGRKAEKVDVCHRRGNETFIMINISSNALSAHLAHGDRLPGDEIPGQPDLRFGDDCSIPGQEDLVQTIRVRSRDSVPVYSDPLDDDQPYMIKVYGTYTFDPERDWADAEWSLFGNVITKGEDLPGLPANILDLSLDGCATNTDWGDLQLDTHLYTLPWTGTGEPLSLMICDTRYDDNKGYLTVEIWKINP